jgi:hypothetical protein
MSRAALWLGGVGTVLAALAVVGWIWSVSVIPPAVFTGQAVACLGAAAAIQRRRRSERARLLPDVSYGTVALGVGAAMILNGVAFGRWLVLIGAGVAALGLAGIAREVVAARRLAR